MVEADFQREYRIDLVEKVKIITWRKFLTLLNGLSAQSLWVYKISQEHKEANEYLEGESAEKEFARFN